MSDFLRSMRTYESVHGVSGGGGGVRRRREAAE